MFNQNERDERSSRTKFLIILKGSSFHSSVAVLLLKKLLSCDARLWDFREENNFVFNNPAICLDLFQLRPEQRSNKDRPIETNNSILWKLTMFKLSNYFTAAVCKLKQNRTPYNNNSFLFSTKIGQNTKQIACSFSPQSPLISRFLFQYLL